jgi:septum formation protein
MKRPGQLVLGCDSVGDLEGIRLDKPGEGLADQLRQISGHRHKLHSAAVVYLDGQPIWRVIETATLHVRPLSETFIADYIARDPEAKWCAGGYRIESLGAQLFEKVEGSWFAIMGLPLLPLLDWLRVRGVLAS